MKRLRYAFPFTEAGWHQGAALQSAVIGIPLYWLRRNPASRRAHSGMLKS